MTREELHQRARENGHSGAPTQAYTTWLEDIILKYVKAEGTSVFHMECLCGNKILTTKKAEVCSSCGRENVVA